MVRGFLRQALLLTSAGAAAGLVIASIATHALQPLLYGVRPFDPGVFAYVTLAVLFVAATAAAHPAWRAARMNPLDALRCE